MTHIVNALIAENRFPSSWKVARISPIPKNNNLVNNSDFRPVSVLPILSKIYERLVLSQLVQCIDQNTLYKETVSGFRKEHSTAVILLKLKDDILKAMKKGEITLAVFTDYSKAFDTVDFRILLKKLYDLGFPTDFLLWIHSYLYGRKQFVQIDDRKSGLLPVSFGVPQGSILGPVLFNLYMADLQNGKFDCNYLQYADDTSLYQHSKVKNLSKCVDDMQKELDLANSWSKNSNLQMNPTKTKTMVFSTSQMSTIHNLASLDLVSMHINHQNIERTKSWKVLGMKLNEHLKWNLHLDEVIRSCYAVLADLRRLKRFTTFHLRKQLAELLVLSKLDYCNCLYGSLPAYLLKRLQKVQNSAAGFVNGRYSKAGDVVSIGWLLIKERIDYSIAKLAFQALNDERWPGYLTLEVKEVTRVLRSNSDGTLRFKHSYIEDTFQYNAAKVFNDIPDDFKCMDFKNFKISLKKLLLDRSKERLNLD